ncbi:hypothetical protein HY032_03650 [Candidatus Gottesmanbacteria bacterium]|nr:hypothetical protein [Candidatus Gottesmanbacteria bacterium]
MPKKTKKEKIIAEYRRRLQGIRETVLTSSEHINESPTPRLAHPSSPYVYQTKTNTPHNTMTVALPMDRAIRRDLIKTLILAAVAIGGEVMLSFIIGR